MNTALIAAAAARALLATQAGATFDVEPVQTLMVSYSDLELGSKAGQTELRQRVRAAAVHVCSVGRFLSLKCYEDAIIDALRKADRAIKENERPPAASTGVVTASGAHAHDRTQHLVARP